MKRHIPHTESHSTTLISRASGERHAIGVSEGESVLAAALRHGLHIPHGCCNGTCGSCRAHILSGRVAYAHAWPPALTPEQAERGEAMLCQALPERDLVVAPERILPIADDLRPRRRVARVARLERLSHDVMGLYLKLPTPDRPRFRAGQHLDVLLRDGRRRSFSMANAPHGDTLTELHVREVPGGLFSGRLLPHLRPRAVLEVAAPLGDLFLREEGGHPIVMLAGDVGIAPLKSMLSDMSQRGLERAVHLYWGVAALRDLYLADWIEEQLGRHENLRFTPVLAAAEPSDHWAGRTGSVHRAVLEDYPDLSGHQVYLSGPPTMVAATRAALAGRGLREDRLFCESFEHARD